MGALIANGTIPLVSNNPSVENDAESVAAFFGGTCAAGNGPLNIVDGEGASWEPLCTACKLHHQKRLPRLCWMTRTAV